MPRANANQTRSDIYCTQGYFFYGGIVTSPKCSRSCVCQRLGIVPGLACVDNLTSLYRIAEDC